MAIFFPRAISASPFQSATARPPVLLNIFRAGDALGGAACSSGIRPSCGTGPQAVYARPTIPNTPISPAFPADRLPPGTQHFRGGRHSNLPWVLCPPGVDCESNVVRPRPSRAHTGLEAVCACPTIASTPISPAFPADRIPPGTQPAHHYKEGGSVAVLGAGAPSVCKGLGEPRKTTP